MDVRKIEPGDVWDGDIVAVMVQEYVPFPSEKWSIHFAKRLRYFSVTSARNNFFSAVDCKGRPGCFDYRQIVKAYRKEV